MHHLALQEVVMTSTFLMSVPCTLASWMGHMQRLIMIISIGEFEFNKLFYLVDGIYPQLTQFVKTISIPLTKKENQFAGWQEVGRKEVERAFGVVQSRYHFCW